jgi:tRNA pseudouridine55 synthase
MNINGIINILKPPGMTSFDVIAHLRKLTGQKRIGHSGTLDPEACGVLPTYFGSACGAIEFAMEHNKTYRAEMILGIKTDTQDITGKIISVSNKIIDDKVIEQTINALVGELMQLPPMYSAIKVNGVKLCDAARKGKDIERNPRKIEIYKSKHILTYNDLYKHENKEVCIKRIIFEISCSKGTYIRTLCNDIGESIDSHGCMTFLTRIQVGEFNLANSITLEELEKSVKEKRINDYIIKVENVFEKYPKLFLNNDEEKKYMNGMAIKINTELDITLLEYFRVYNVEGTFISLGAIKESDDSFFIKSKKFF